MGFEEKKGNWLEKALEERGIKTDAKKEVRPEDAFDKTDRNLPKINASRDKNSRK